MEDQTTPATKADIQDLDRQVIQLDTKVDGLDKKIGQLDTRVDQLERRLTEVASSFDSKLMNFAEEIKRHFDVIAEDLRHDVIGANRDEVLSIVDKQQQNSDRIRHLEQLAGMPA